MKEAKLKCDIASSMKKDKIYGKKGEPVTVISDRSSVWIVENKKGERFPVSVNDLITE